MTTKPIPGNQRQVMPLTMSLISFLASSTLLLHSTSRFPRFPFLLHALAPGHLAYHILHRAKYARLRRRGCVLCLCVAHLLQAGLPGLFARIVAKGRGYGGLSV